MTIETPPVETTLIEYGIQVDCRIPRQKIATPASGMFVDDRPDLRADAQAGLKTQYELDEFDTSDEHVVRILLYAALLSLLVSRDLLDLVTEQADDELVFPTERWAATFRSRAQLILHELGEYLGYSPPPLLERLIEDAQKIYKQRTVLQKTLATATQPMCES